MLPDRRARPLWRHWILLGVAASWVHASAAAPSAALGYEPKYHSGFSHFDYVNPKAPKGGQIVLSGFGTFDSLNPFLLKGVAAEGINGLVIETLMEQSLDEPYSLYASIAEDIVLAEDGLSVTFRLNPAARFSDGKPVTAADVKFCFDTLKGDKAHPFYRFYWADVKKAEVLGEREIRFDFAKRNPELHLIMAQMPVFSPAWLGDKAFDKTVLEHPIGTGPYTIDKVDLGKSISYVRNENYWAKNLNTRRGMFNFDKIAFKYYRDEDVQLEAFKAGEFDFMFVLHSKQWARDYVGPQFDSGAIKKVELPHSNNAGMQGFVFNTRREKFSDRRVRRAISLAFDFEWSNKRLFYDQYTRCDSYFSNSELAASGLPVGDELKLLEQFRTQLDPEVFTQVWRPPSTAPPGSLRENLRAAKHLLEEAGWRVKDGILRDAQDQPLEFEVLLAQKGFERILAPFARNLARLGIVMTYRTVDAALYQRRVDTFNFDMVVTSWAQSQSPGNEQINMWDSRAADREGSRNLAGIKDPVVDALVEKIIYASDRSKLVTAAKALDRVLLHGEYVVPNWYIAVHRLAYWDRYDYPPKLPLYYGAEAWMLKTWWQR